MGFRTKALANEKVITDGNPAAKMRVAFSTSQTSTPRKNYVKQKKTKAVRCSQRLLLSHFEQMFLFQGRALVGQVHARAWRQILIKLQSLAIKCIRHRVAGNRDNEV